MGLYHVRLDISVHHALVVLEGTNVQVNDISVIHMYI